MVARRSSAQMAPRGPQAAARRRARVPRRRGGRRQATARTGWSTTTPTCSRACTEAISEVGGFSFTVAEDQRLYLIETAREGHRTGCGWSAEGRAGHGSMVNDDNAVTALCRGGRPDRPARVADAADADGARASSRRSPTRSASSSTRTTRSRRWPSSARWPGSSAPRCATPPTRPCSRPATSTTSSRRRAEAYVDGRFLPGLRGGVARDHRRAARARTSRARPCIQDIALETDVRRRPGRRDGRRAAGRGPGRAGRARTACPAAPTTSRSALLGIRGFGFAPLRLPADLDFAGMFHGVDERVPLDALQFGVRVLDRFLAAS